MTERVQVHGLQIARVLHDLVRDDIAPGSGLAPEPFWQGFAKVTAEFAPRNRALLQRRDELQASIDRWHIRHRGQGHDQAAYVAFLEDIGYLLPAGEDFVISTANVDAEIASLSGPQLVVPLSNARYALNAANARWGSLYDALYGTDAISQAGALAPGQSDNPVRGAAVVAAVQAFLDAVVPLEGGSYSDVVHYSVQQHTLVAQLQDGSQSALKEPRQFAGYRQGAAGLEAILLVHHGLHIELQINATHPVGSASPAGVSDVLIESALSVIQDCEDSVAAVDAEDKQVLYRHWLGLMKGDLRVQFERAGQTVERALNSDRHYLAPDGRAITLPGRGLMLIRNVGLHMMSDAVLDPAGSALPEGILDAAMTAYIARSERATPGSYQNSRSGSVYIVKPKLHGPEEVRFTQDLFAAIEDMTGLPHNTLKLGLMDEERRTSINLKACIREASERLVFINTGFLDRTGDEIHTAMEAGPVVRKGDMKSAAWYRAYEDWNVDIGLACGLSGHAQIGKGMWPKPAAMAEMLASKVEHPLAGANCAWVPSPTAATLHAMHYHRVDVRARQQQLHDRQQASLNDMLTLPLAEPAEWSAEEIQQELDNNCQGLLGYVVRWIGQGVGCSTVPDIHNTGLMEDRATLRISSQHIANWLHHGIVSREQVESTLARMAGIVDQQNSDYAAYHTIADHPDSPAYRAALELVFAARGAPNGYTEPTLHTYRRQLQRSHANAAG